MSEPSNGYNKTYEKSFFVGKEEVVSRARSATALVAVLFLVSRPDLI